MALASVALAALGCLAAAAQTAPRGKTPTAAQQFKNIKVLKDLPADRLLPVMFGMNASLGVRCDHCHVVEETPGGQHTGFEKDTKPEKEMARKMILMTQDLNAHQQILDRKASCYMCHHGHAKPETQAPMPQFPGAPPPGGGANRPGGAAEPPK